ncbi:hypothetical protein, conserved [Trypanosoma cruzi]|uniref:Guanine nucleotide-binding protein subunit beta-like protein n=2 Tax=Trypanosoma cruzi TaxID=5693 RepID=Q4DMR4_TRYCC|nr:hypothetical protein, conserved [Trypanosoma cruzi]EAN93828.1 hypothetical protein, conserved [Trypanosoma cruzi]|eukprot:XP_815679.1 hypothetical protein [Trypanosoma cruzi strain CL Brener]
MDTKCVHACMRSHILVLPPFFFFFVSFFFFLLVGDFYLIPRGGWWGVCVHTRTYTHKKTKQRRRHHSLSAGGWRGKMQPVHTVRTSDEDDTYVLDGCVCNDGSSLCLSVSDHTIRCYDTHTATFLFTLTGHTCAIKDVTTSASQATVLYSSQEDTGVMISDMRQVNPAHFLSEFCGKGATGGTVGVTPNGRFLGVAVNGDTHIVDTRMWHTTHVIANMHLDEITRLRFLDDTVYCSAGEDQMINFIDSASEVAENDMLLQAISCGEVVTKMTAFSHLGVLGLVGSCENAYLFPFDLQEKEVRYPRPDQATYLVEMCVLAGQPYLVRGVRDDDGNVGPLSLMNWATRDVTQLAPVHRETCRMAIGVGECLVTGGEDGLVAFWRTNDTAGAVTATTLTDAAALGRGVMKSRHHVTRPLRSMPYAK